MLPATEAPGKEWPPPEAVPNSAKPRATPGGKGGHPGAAPCPLKLLCMALWCWWWAAGTKQLHVEPPSGGDWAPRELWLLARGCENGLRHPAWRASLGASWDSSRRASEGQPRLHEDSISVSLREQGRGEGKREREGKEKGSGGGGRSLGPECRTEGEPLG